MSNILNDTSEVWKSPKVKAILNEPTGTPVDLAGLTAEEISALAREAKGMWADHPNIRDAVKWSRTLRREIYRGDPEE